MDKTIGVLLTCPISAYLQTSLEQRFTLFRFYQIPHSSKSSFLKSHSASIRALVGNGQHGADAALIESLPKLEIIASHSSGLDQIDLIKCKEKGIQVTYVPGASAEDVADLAILLAIATLRKICVADRFIRCGFWKNGEFQLTSKFNGKAVGIVGLGTIGLAIARRAEAFNCEINYYSRTKKPHEKYKHYPNVVDLASNSRILIISCALTDETRHMINREVLNALGPEGIVINVARGGLIDQGEMIAGLVEGWLGGAGLDVVEGEPNVAEELIGLDNVVLTPHVGACTVETRMAMADLVVANLEAHFLKRPLLTPVPCILNSF